MQKALKHHQIYRSIFGFGKFVNQWQYVWVATNVGLDLDRIAAFMTPDVLLHVHWGYLSEGGKYSLFIPLAILNYLWKLSDWCWSDDHHRAFVGVNGKVSNIPTLRHSPKSVCSRWNRSRENHPNGYLSSRKLIKLKKKQNEMHLNEFTTIGV